MTITAHVYSKVPKSLADKILDVDSDALKCMLLSAYTVGSTQDSAQFVSDVLAAGTEAAGTGYTAGGQALASVTFTLSGHVYTLDAADPSWNASGGALTAAYALFYDSTPGTNSTNPVICYWDFGGSVTATNTNFVLQLNAGGFTTFTGS